MELMTVLLAMLSKPLRAVSRPIYDLWSRVRREVRVRRMVAAYPWQEAHREKPPLVRWPTAYPQCLRMHASPMRPRVRGSAHAT